MAKALYVAPKQNVLLAMRALPLWLLCSVAACSTKYCHRSLETASAFHHGVAVSLPCAVAIAALDHRVAHKLLTVGMGVARWTKALGDLQGLGCSLSRSNMEALFRSAVHAPVRTIVLCTSYY